MDDPVKTIYDNWGNRASLREPDTCRTEGLIITERTYHVGGYIITVPTDTSLPAKVSNKYRHWGQNENLIPNMSFSDGEMRIPIEDFIDLLLRRVPADELAEGLWTDESVRERFVYCMAERYAGGSIEDADRRKLLNKIQVAIHSVSVDKVIERLNHLESELRAKSSRSRWEIGQLGHYKGLYEKYEGLLVELAGAGLFGNEEAYRRLQLVTTPEKLKEHLEGQVDPVCKESVGTQWQESRDFWRKRLEEAFPEPTIVDTIEETF